MRDIRRGEPEINAAADVIRAVAPDILLLTNFDYDADLIALAAFADLLGDDWQLFARVPNAGQMTPMDLNGDGRLGGRDDAQGYGRFAGDGGMAILSRTPLVADRDFSSLLWRDLPGARLPVNADGALFPDKAAYDIQRLSSNGHWVVSVPRYDLSLLVFDATPPVFDGPEDRNGLRNGDEIRLWSRYLDGVFGDVPARFAIMGNANLDPDRGERDRRAIIDLLADPRLQDPEPGWMDADRRRVETVSWPDETGPGAMRVSYILPSRNLTVMDAGVLWPDDGALGESVDIAGPHRLIWVDIEPTEH